MKKITSILLVCLIILMTACSTSEIENNHPFYLIFEDLHNGDAVFYGSHETVITSVDGELIIIDTLTDNINMSGISASWLDTESSEGLIVYCNREKELGIVTLTKYGEIKDNRIIRTSERLMIDPTITKTENGFFITFTEIEGNVNNSDPEKDNGEYSIYMISSEDGHNWDEASCVIRDKSNLEDIYTYYDGTWKLIFEREKYDQQSSEIIALCSNDAFGNEWIQETVLLPMEADQESAAFVKTEEGYRLYYSSDKDAPGKSYAGGKIYYADFNKNLQPISRDNLVETVTETGILLYDVLFEDQNTFFLYATDYFGSCNLIVEEVRE